MKQITVLSGKGGTGKTSLVAAFAALSQRLVVSDCDVDAPDLHLLLHPRVVETQAFTGARLATIDPTQCIHCGKCEDSCRFNAITEEAVDPVLCEGCGVCAYVCPVAAITWTDRLSGYAYLSQTRYGPMSHARLNPGEENSGKLVTLVRQNAKQFADAEGCDLILNDGPPGIGCPVIAAVGGVDLGLLVVEPTLSGIHDMERALALLAHFQIPPLVCINKYDVNLENTRRIDAFCRTRGIGVAGKIPFDPLVTQAMVAGQPVVVYAPTSRVTDAINEMWQQTLHRLSVTA